MGKNILLFASLLLYIFFYRFWEDIIANVIVDKFLCHFESNILNDIIWIVMSALCVIGLIHSDHGKTRKPSTTIIYILAILFWLYYRFLSNRFSFTSLSLCSNIMYIDLVPFYALCKLLPAFDKKARSLYSNDTFSNDQPIENEKEDILGRRDYAQEFIAKILEDGSRIKPFSYGIDLPWGAGKTSFMNLMKEQLKLYHESDIIVMDFNPWLCFNDRGIAPIFLEELSKTLKRYDHFLAETFLKLSKLMGTIDIKEVKIISSIIGSSYSDTPLNTMVEKLKLLMEKIQKKVIVFVDDIDKLRSAELVEMMKLIRNFSETQYIVMVAAYDKSFLLNSLRELMPNREQYFVERIFPMEFHIPPCPNEVLRTVLYNSLMTDIDADVYRQELSRFIKDESSDNPLCAISTLRDVKRLVSNYAAVDLNLRGDINVIDLLTIELLKTKYPVVFSHFKRKSEKALVLRLDSQSYSLYTNDKPDQSHINFLQFVDEHSVDFKLNAADVKSVTSILLRLFGASQSKVEGRLMCKECFDRYMSL